MQAVAVKTPAWCSLHGCLAHHTAYSEITAWAHRTSPEITQAA